MLIIKDFYRFLMKYIFIVCGLIFPKRWFRKPLFRKWVGEVGGIYRRILYKEKVLNLMSLMPLLQN